MSGKTWKEGGRRKERGKETERGRERGREGGREIPLTDGNACEAHLSNGRVDDAFIPVLLVQALGHLRGREDEKGGNGKRKGKEKDEDVARCGIWRVGTFWWVSMPRFL